MIQSLISASPTRQSVQRAKISSPLPTICDLRKSQRVIESNSPVDRLQNYHDWFASKMLNPLRDSILISIVLLHSSDCPVVAFEHIPCGVLPPQAIHPSSAADSASASYPRRAETPSLTCKLAWPTSKGQSQSVAFKSMVQSDDLHSVELTEARSRRYSVAIENQFARSHGHQAPASHECLPTSVEIAEGFQLRPRKTSVVMHRTESQNLPDSEASSGEHQSTIKQICDVKTPLTTAPFSTLQASRQIQLVGRANAIVDRDAPQADDRDAMDAKSSIAIIIFASVFAWAVFLWFCSCAICPWAERKRRGSIRQDLSHFEQHLQILQTHNQNIFTDAMIPEESTVSSFRVVSEDILPWYRRWIPGLGKPRRNPRSPQPLEQQDRSSQPQSWIQRLRQGLGKSKQDRPANADASPRGSSPETTNNEQASVRLPFPNFINQDLVSHEHGRSGNGAGKARRSVSTARSNVDTNRIPSRTNSILRTQEAERVINMGS